MDNQQATRKIQLEDLAWLGGVIDGEGCVSIWKRQRANSYSYFPEIVISNSDPVFIEEVCEILRLVGIGHWVTWRKPHNRQSKKMMGAVDIKGFKRCEHALNILLPYIRSKREQAKLTAEFISRRLTINYTSKNSYDSTDDEFCTRVKELKKRGAPETIRGGRFGNEDGKI